MSERLREKIIDELSTLPNVRMSQDKAMICCPFHADKTPSAKINLDITAPAPMGWFNCFGASCKKSAPWNTVASALGLRKFGKSKKSADDYIDPGRFKDELIGEDDEDHDTSTAGFQQELASMEFFDFSQEEWRGVPVSLLRRVGAKLVYLDRTGDFYVWLPVNINNQLKGYVKATLEKAPSGETSYINAKGGWSREFGLLFYDYALRLMKRKGLDTVVLVEGPRDALRLLRYGIPAMAVLGAINWDDNKRYVLEQSGVSNVILFLDGDDAGLTATKKIYKSVKMHFNVLKVMKLWKYRTPRIDPETGEQAFKIVAEDKKILLWDNEQDPGNCDKKFLIKVRDALK
jgi:5S rRNA maturation endonuclease (ribonuclease M5)